MTKIAEIVHRRLKRIRERGHDMGKKIPARRPFPLVAFGQDPFLVCEFKRRSPSRGLMPQGKDAVSQVKIYKEKGIRTVSVLTEEDYFCGSLEDLVRIKEAFPELCLLRKDFLIDEADIEISYRAGADALLLIACMHDLDILARLYKKAKGMGMEVLFEVHTIEDIAKARQLRPEFTGINSRDLATFKIDLTHPLRLKTSIDWNTKAVFESGISQPEHAAFALSGGFSGLLCGEALMRNPHLVDDMVPLFSQRLGDFWPRLLQKEKKGVPYIKICGVTREEDAFTAAENGADILGFIFADSLRRAAPELLKRIRDLDILKVGVVVYDKGTTSIDDDVRGLLDEGLLHALQFHGAEDPESCYTLAFPYYKAVRIKEKADAKTIGLYHCPRVLIDAFVQGAKGGTGKRIPPDLVHAVREECPLWLAGGIGPDNARGIVKEFQPELIDASSLLESSPGKKDQEKIKRFFKELNSAALL